MNMSRETLRAELLVAFGENLDGLTTEEAALKANVHHVGVNYWTRVSELKKLHYITPKYFSGTQVRRPTQAGGLASVYVISAEGIAALDSLNQPVAA